MEMPVAPSQRKRVHFSYPGDSDEDEAPRAKKPRFPKGKKDSQGDTSGKTLGVVDGEEDDGTILSTDPRVAALDRATRRDREAELLLAEDTSVPNDVLLAEEEYDVEDEERVEDGMRIEPFNLKQEREEGYFDAEGNYVEYRNDGDTKDAWLESVELNTRFAGKAIAKSIDDSEGDKDLSKEEIAGIKRRIADALQSGETVLRALRRLKGIAKEGNRDGRMSGDTKVLFDRLTEDAMKLLDNGDYNVYEEKKETFQREAEGYEALARLRSGVSSGSGSLAGESSRNNLQDHSDMFADGQDGNIEKVWPSRNGFGLPFGSDVKQENGNDLDIFGGSDEDDTAEGVVIGNPGGISAKGGETLTSVGSAVPGAAEGAVPVEGSGYVFDPSSGYYYNSDLGYYYDAFSGLYCSANTGQWYKFDEERNSYEEVAQ